VSPLHFLLWSFLRLPLLEILRCTYRAKEPLAIVLLRHLRVIIHFDLQHSVIAFSPNKIRARDPALAIVLVSR